MHLVDVSEFYSEFGGGVRTYVRQKLAASARAGARTTIIAPGPSDRRQVHDGGEIIYVRSPTLPFDHRYWIFGDMRPVRDLLDSLKPDVVEASSSWQGARIVAGWRGAAAKSLFLHQDPVAVYPHSFFSPAIAPDRVDAAFGWFWRYMRRLSSRFDATIAPSEIFARRLALFGINGPVACPLGVDKTAFSHSLRDEETRAAMLAACGVDHPQATLFLAVGRHHPEKRLPMLIAGFRAFAAERPAALFVIGDGPMRRAVSRAATREPGVCVAGAETDRARLARRLASADVLVHGGAAETYGLVVAEALASGLPVVTPDIGGASELSHPAFSETYAFGRAEALADAMRRIVARDRADLSLAARAGANRVRSPDEHFAALFDVYASMATGKSLRRAA